jgi:hypothetical protein
MKHVLTSAGLVALGVTALNAYDPEMTRQLTGRPWTVGATVRGFYDDNINTSPKRLEEESFGVEVRPSVHLNLPMEQTFIALGYIYSLKWYENRDPRRFDQSHEFNGKLRHQFGPKHDIGVDDSFVLSSEPTVAERGGIITAPTRLRTRAGVLHNRGAIEDNIWLTQQVGLSFGYVNNWYDYEQENAPGQIGSRSALLDRIEHLFRADARYQVNPKLVALVGYMFGLNTYTGDDVIAIRPSGLPLMSEDRDSTTHYIYAGADFDLTARLRASVRAGGQFTDYDANGSSANPYADASLTYVYLPGSSVEAGVRHQRNATDVSQIDSSGTPTFDAETTVFYAQITHRITHNLTASLLGQFQSSEFNDGLWGGQGEDLYLVGVNLDYRINRHLSVEAGYNFDKLCSDVKDGAGREVRSYDRNQVYIGLRATY